MLVPPPDPPIRIFLGGVPGEFLAAGLLDELLFEPGRVAARSRMKPRRYSLAAGDVLCRGRFALGGLPYSGPV
jgi:hypothetical protein